MHKNYSTDISVTAAIHSSDAGLNGHGSSVATDLEVIRHAQGPFSLPWFSLPLFIITITTLFLLF